MENQNGLVVVTLDVDPKDNAGGLANFARRNNYHWVFANSTDMINQGFNKLYNSQSINPSALQTLVIDRMGDVHALPNGMKSASELSQDLAAQ